jgi:hypothetical protein
LPSLAWLLSLHPGGPMPTIGGMDTTSGPGHVEACFRCGKPAELPAVGSGHVGGREEGHVALCVACLELLLGDPAAFWQGMRKRKE